MSDTKSGDDKTLSVTPKKTLTLKRPGMEQGTVRQNFSHGRTKSVVVETKKRKFVHARRQAGAGAPLLRSPVADAEAARSPPRRVVQEAPRRRPPPPPPAPSSARGMVLNELSRSEMEARRRRA